MEYVFFFVYNFFYYFGLLFQNFNLSNIVNENVFWIFLIGQYLTVFNSIFHIRWNFSFICVKIIIGKKNIHKEDFVYDNIYEHDPVDWIGSYTTFNRKTIKIKD